MHEWSREPIRSVKDELLGKTFHLLICYELLLHCHMFEVDGLALGELMFRKKMQDKAMPIPAIIQKTDDEYSTAAKGLILEMVHADPSVRCSMQQARDSINILYGECWRLIFTLMITKTINGMVVYLPK